MSDAEASLCSNPSQGRIELGAACCESYLPVLVFVGLGAIVGTAFAVLNRMRRPQARSAARATKADPYECGLPSEVSRTFRFGVSFYMVAMLFILFDIEVVFLYPVGVILQRGRLGLRPRRAADLRRPAAGRADLRLAPGCARLEVRREKLRGARAARRAGLARAPAGAPAARARPAARRPRRRRARGARRAGGADDLARQAARLGRLELDVPDDLRARLLRDRDDRGRSARRATTSPASAPRRCAPRRARPTSSSSRAGSRSRWRRSSGASTTRCSSHAGRSRWAPARPRAGCSPTTRSSRAPTSSCRSTSTSPAARRGPRR